MFSRYYHQTIRKVNLAFGSLFNNIYATRFDASGATASHIKVPLGYGKKEKWIRRFREENKVRGGETDVRITLPRLSFSMNSISFDASRKKNTVQKRFKAGTDNTSIFSNFMEVPYDIEFEVSAMVRFMEDGLSIVEQILPHFTPEFTISLNLNDSEQNVDVPIILTSVDVQEEGAEGDFEELRIITFTLSFTAKTNVYGPLKSGKPIQTVTTTFFEPIEFYGEGNSLGLSGATAALSKVIVGVTGPSGSSSGVDNYTAFTVDTRVYGMTGEDGISLDGSNL